MPSPHDESQRRLDHLYARRAILTQNVQLLQEKVDFYGGPVLAPLVDRNTLIANQRELDDVLKEIAARESPPESAGPPFTAEVTLLLDVLPTAVLHLYDRDRLPLVRFRLTNPTAEAVRAFPSCDIEGFSYRRTDTVDVPAGQTVDFFQLPLLNMASVAGLNQVTNAVLHTRVHRLRDGDREFLLEQDFHIRFLARDVLIWAIREAPLQYQDLTSHLAAWVTPRSPGVARFLREVVKGVPPPGLTGYLPGGPPVRDQVRAVFEALHASAKIAYVHSPINFGQKDGVLQQRVNLPDDSLKLRQANCLDGAVLYASLLEAIDLNPVIVLIPGHAVVGWETARGSGKYEFLETTQTGTGDFKLATDSGQKLFEKYGELKDSPLLDSLGYARLLDVRALHAQGILPL
jgi:hypothetical protein